MQLQREKRTFVEEQRLMVESGEISLADVRRVVHKHWWIAPVCALSFCAMATVTALWLPKKFTSETLVLVSRPTVPREYVNPVVSDDMNQRLASMKEQILSRTRLEPIIQRFDLYHNERNQAFMSTLVDRLRKAIDVSPLQPMPGTQDRTLPGFNVSVTFENPIVAQQICSEITSMFIGQNSRLILSQGERTTEFLSQELDDAKSKLDQQDAKLAQLKRQFIGSLPEEEQANLSLLASLNAQLEANTQAVSRAHQNKSFNESFLAQQVASWKTPQATHSPETSDQQLRILEDQLAALQSRYTPQHPDVLKAENQLAEFKKRMSTASKNPIPEGVASSAVEPPEIQQLRARLRQDDVIIADLSQRQRQIQDQIHVLQERIQSSPMVEQQLKELTRNYQTASDFYNDLLKKRANSAMATDLAHEQEGEQFRILDPPSLPTSPSFPKKTYFALGGFGGGLALGIGILYLLMVSDKTFHTERDVENYLKLPVLALVPDLGLTGGGDERSG